MNSNTLLFAFYEISLSIGNTFDLKKMLNESLPMILSRLNCSSVVIYQKNRNSYEILEAKPKVLMRNPTYISTIQELEEKFSKNGHRILVEKVDNKYYYLFDLKNFGYLVLTKSGEPLNTIIVNSLTNINIKLLNAIQACLGHKALEESQSRLFEVQRIAHLGSWMTSLTTTKNHHWDDELFRILGEEPQSFEPTYKKLLQKLAPTSRRKMSKVIAKVFSGKLTEYKGVVEIIKTDGSTVIAEVQSKIIFDNNGKAIFLVGTTLDISKRYQLEKQLRDESTLLKSIINTVPVRIFWKDLESQYLGGNKLFAKDAGLEDEGQLIGKDDYEMPWKNEAVMYRAFDKRVVDTGIGEMNVEEPLTSKDGIVSWVSTSKVPLTDGNGKIFGTLGTYMDITNRKENEKNLKLQRDALEHQAYHDVLTGLPNRLLFLDRLNQYIHKSHRDKNKVAVFFIDMDRFKEINDTLGHTFGDEVIIEVAHRIANQIRETDTIARFGGDEFIMICNGIENPIDIASIIEKIMLGMDDPICINGHSIYVTLSIGISVYPNDADTADDLLKNADAAMYEAKDSGRNTYKFYTEDMTEKAFTRIKLESCLRQAIEDEDFMLYFQPQVNAKTNKITGMETLVRWEHSSMGFITPDVFIPIAEDTGLIISLGKWILKHGMQQMVKWYDDGLNPGVLAINFSMLQLQKADFISMLKKMLDETMCKAQWIEVEITESQVMKNPEHTISTLQKISELGIKIAIDDFGTGYSSLSYLKRLPISRLKIDRSFIQDIPEDEDDMAIAKAIIALAISLSLDVIAEGVETREQEDFLVKNECSDIQGYLYAKPMPANEMEKMLKESSKKYCQESKRTHADMVHTLL